MREGSPLLELDSKYSDRASDPMGVLGGGWMRRTERREGFLYLGLEGKKKRPGGFLLFSERGGTDGKSKGLREMGTRVEQGKRKH